METGKHGPCLRETSFIVHILVVNHTFAHCIGSLQFTITSSTSTRGSSRIHSSLHSTHSYLRALRLRLGSGCACSSDFTSSEDCPRFRLLLLLPPLPLPPEGADGADDDDPAAPGTVAGESDPAGSSLGTTSSSAASEAAAPSVGSTHVSSTPALLLLPPPPLFGVA